MTCRYIGLLTFLYCDSIDIQDTNGCTVTHIMVVYDNINMFDMAVECGAAINIENNQGLTPLTTAAFLAR